MRIRVVRWAVVLVVSIASLLMAACGDDDDNGNAAGGGSGDGSPKSLYASFYTQELPYYQAIHKGYQDRAKELGWELNAEFANGTPDQQFDQIQTALTQQPDAMLISPINPEALIPPIRQASEQGIPVLTVANTIADPDLLIGFTGTLNEDIGKVKAEFIVDQLGGKGRVGVIHGIRGLPFSEEQWDGADEVFKATPGLEVIDGGYAGGFSSDLGLDKTQNLLTRAGELDALYYDSDDLALGGLKALQARNISPEDIVTIGTDGTPEALAAVKDGRMDFTVSLCGYTQGVQAMDILERYFENDEKPPATSPAKTKAVTKEVAEADEKALQQQKC